MINVVRSVEFDDFGEDYHLLAETSADHSVLGSHQTAEVFLPQGLHHFSLLVDQGSLLSHEQALISLLPLTALLHHC